MASAWASVLVLGIRCPRVGRTHGGPICSTIDGEGKGIQVGHRVARLFGLDGGKGGF